MNSHICREAVGIVADDFYVLSGRERCDTTPMKILQVIGGVTSTRLMNIVLIFYLANMQV